jgi:glycerophosphodiester phosphodiesterase
MKRNLLLIAITGLLMAACNSGGENLERVPIFKVLGPTGTVSTDVPIAIDGKAQEVSFRVYASGTWSALMSENSTGFSLSDTSGTAGDTSVKVVAAANRSGATRSATVTFVMNDSVYAYTIEQEEEQPYLDPVKLSFVISGYAQELNIAVETNQESWTYDLGDASTWLTERSKDNSSLVLSVAENKSGEVRNARIKIWSALHPEVFTFITVEQDWIIEAPVADLLDVVFGENCAASDASAMSMAIDGSCLDATVSTQYSERYGRWVAVFSAEPVTAAHDTGFWKIPYTTRTDFAEGLEDGYSIELLFARGDTQAPGKQIKPFASTQAGGTGMCFRATTHEINWEIHSGGTRTGDGYKFTGGKWNELYSGVVPQKDVFYHTVLTWDKTEGKARCYVNGELTTTLNVTGNFDHMVSNVNAYWFGLGADPNASDKGELSFQGTIVLARIYDDPLTSQQVNALYQLVE